MSLSADNRALSGCKAATDLVKCHNRAVAVTTHTTFFLRGSEMFNSNIVKLAAVGAVFALAGCQDLKPIQADIATLKTQVGALQSDMAAHKADNTRNEQAATAAANKAASDAAAASQAAAAAQSTANQALSAAQAAQAGVDATNEKIDRMFKRSVSK